MNAGVMGMNASPFDMLLGFGMQNIPRVSPETGDFGKLMNLFPQFQQVSEALTGTGKVPIPGMMTGLPQPLSAEEMPTLLPESLAAVLGVKPEDIPEQINPAIAAAGAEQVVTIPAQLVVVPDENNKQQLYLKVQPETMTEVNPALLIESESAAEEEMLIPMQLRTVEQDGQRLIADAQLRTATGENVSVRLKLDVAGMTQPQLTEDGFSRGMAQPIEVTPQRQNNLVALLGNLGVKSLVVETIDESSTQTTQQLLPRAAGQPVRGLGDMSLDQLRGQAEAVETADGKTQRVNPFMQMSQQDSNARQDMLFGQAKGDDSMMQLNRTTVDNVAISTADAATENTQVTSAPKAPETSQVRYYNIDQGLERLKQNPGQRIQVQLSPASLGKMDLSIVNHRGIVTVHLTMESAQAKQAVERNLGQLESHLSSSGIKVDSFQVTVNESNRPGAYSGHQFNQQGFFGDRHQGRNFRRFNQQLKQGFDMTSEKFERVMVNYLA